MDNLIKRYNILNSEYINNDNLKAKKLKAKLKYKIISQARQEGIGLYSDTYNYLYQENEYQEIKNNYKEKQYISNFKMNKIV